MYSFNSEGKTYGEVRANLRGKELLNSPTLSVNVPVEKAPDFIAHHVKGKAHIALDCLVNNGKRIIYNVLA